MVRITEDLVRKRSEHNELQISTLEEISLHQQDIERIEHLDRWCRHLKILYLQSNLIPRIENVSRLKKLEYINLALNNIEKVENLEGCESLKKLDLTVNFIGELTSIESLKENYNFRELYLTGNPCTDFEDYREFVIATLPQLQWLDGTQIEKSERIKAIQNLPFIKGSILQQQDLYRKKREKQKAQSKVQKSDDVNDNARKDSGDGNCSEKQGFDGRWYTDINEWDSKVKIQNDVNEDKTHQEKVDVFWNEKVPYTPESRIDVHNHLKELKEKDEKKDETEEKQPRRLFSDDGRPFNINEPKVDFRLTDDHKNIYLDLKVFKHMDSSLLDCDIQPEYVRVTMKGKIFQLCLTEEVNAEKSDAKRSQTTGHLLITMPKVKQVIKRNNPTPASNDKKDTSNVPKKEENNFLEVDPTAMKSVDISNIVQNEKSNSGDKKAPFGSRNFRQDVKERDNSKEFVDDPDVPPLL